MKRLIFSLLWIALLFVPVVLAAATGVLLAVGRPVTGCAVAFIAVITLMLDYSFAMGRGEALRNGMVPMVDTSWGRGKKVVQGGFRPGVVYEKEAEFPFRDGFIVLVRDTRFSVGTPGSVRVFWSEVPVSDHIKFESDHRLRILRVKPAA